MYDYVLDIGPVGNPDLAVGSGGVDSLLDLQEGGVPGFAVVRGARGVAVDVDDGGRCARTKQRAGDEEKKDTSAHSTYILR